MIIEFFNNGIKRVIRTPRKTRYSEVVIENLKKVILIVVRKKQLNQKKSFKLKNLGESLLADKINLNTYWQEKEKTKNITRRKKTFVIKIEKDKSSLVKIQKQFFE